MSFVVLSWRDELAGFRDLGTLSMQSSQFIQKITYFTYKLSSTCKIPKYENRNMKLVEEETVKENSAWARKQE